VCRLILIIAGLCLWTAPAVGATEAALLRYLERAEQRYAQIQDYTAVMVSRERINGSLEPEKAVLLKFQRPFKVYMKWLDGAAKGREGIYVLGAHDGKFLVIEPNGLRRFFTAALEPGDPRVMEVSRHPVTDVGIGRVLEIIGENVRRAFRQKVLKLVDRGVGEVAGRRVREIEGILPADRAADYYGHRVILSFDEEHQLPIRVVVYDGENRLIEDYTYSQLRLNPGFSNTDFDPGNPAYGFSKWKITIPD
jgi:outer membrane lipoprotein-sorting protein